MQNEPADAVNELAIGHRYEEAEYYTKSVEAYDLCVRGRFLYQRSMAEEGKEARRLFEQAIALDPDYAEAHAYLAWTHWMGWVNL
jgi:cytochrome c-type biogenesis protein CcmH/NrfG